MEVGKAAATVESPDPGAPRIPQTTMTMTTTTKRARLAGLLRRARPPRAAVNVTPSFLLLVALSYGVLYFAMPFNGAWLPGSPYFATLVIWVCGLAGAEVAHWLRLPRVLGMLLSGPFLANVGGGAAVAGFPRKWGTQMRAAALATIFLRCGLELEFKVSLGVAGVGWLYGERARDGRGFSVAIARARPPAAVAPPLVSLSLFLSRSLSRALSQTPPPTHPHTT